MPLAAVVLGFVLGQPSLCVTKLEPIALPDDSRPIYIKYRDRCPFVAMVAQKGK